MAHWSENSRCLACVPIKIDSIQQLENVSHAEPATYLFWLPFGRTQQDAQHSTVQFQALAKLCAKLNAKSTVCFLTTPEDAALLLTAMAQELTFQHWVAVKTTRHAYAEQVGELPRRHAALLIFTRYEGVLGHTRTRIKYSYCPACGGTTKDYGGKTQMYHEYGTSISDVWSDVEYDPALGVGSIVERLQDLFGLTLYRDLSLVDLHNCAEFLPAVTENTGQLSTGQPRQIEERHSKRLRSRLIHGDCLEALRSIPNNSIEFCFADLPYNLKKKYSGSKDNLETVEYFRWCDEWLAELCRVLKPGGTLAVLNLPLWAARHFKYLSSVMTFRAWVVWDALSLPFRKIMPAHYAILCFSKGELKPLPGLASPDDDERAYLTAQTQGFCVRPGCRRKRPLLNIQDRGELIDIWQDVHRLKHNTRRVNHPCQLPPLLMRRLLSLFTKGGDIILDCFDAAGTSTLVAAQMGRRYIGIEKSKRYHNLAMKRHKQIREGHDPFEKGKEVPKSKNNQVPRIPAQKYAVTKKDLQLDVKRISMELGRVPTRDEVARYSDHPITYFKEYFANWGEVCAAARTSTISDVPSPT